MGLLSANLKAKILAGTADLYWAYVLTLPTPRQVSDHAVASLTGGLFEGRVLDWSPFRRNALDSHGHLEIGDATVTVDDTDRSIAALVASSTANAIRGSAVTVYLAERSLAQSDWLSYLVGQVAAPPDWPAPLQAQFRLTLADLPLRAKVPALMTRSTWPYAADTGVIGSPAPEVYGRHDSRGQGDGGMIPCLLVDSTTNRYLVQRRYATAVDRVFVDGLEVYTGWSVVNVTRGGSVYTVIEFASAPTGDVTADVQGVDDAGTGAGALITNPVLELQDWLEMIGMTCDAALFASAAAWATRHGRTGSFRIAEQRVALDILNDFVDSIGALAFFTNSGKLGIAIDAHDDTAVYPDANALIYVGGGRDDVEPIKPTREYDQIIDSITGRFSFNSATGDFTQTLPVRDPNLSEGSDEDYPMPASWAAVVE
jgi:hypothetical protein